MSTRSVSRARRSERISAAVVTGVSLLIGGLFLWVRIASSEVEGAWSAAQLVVFVMSNAAAGGLLWWHRRFPVRVFAATLAVYVVSAIATTTVGNGGLTLPLWFSVFALTAYAPLTRACVAILVGWVVDTVVKVSLTNAAGYTLSASEVVLAFIADVGFFYVACGVLGLGFRSQHQRAREATERARLVEERSRALHAEAVATERNRLARDLHDLAAHELMDALLAVRALQVTVDDPMLSEIEERTSRALGSMRAVVRTLREDDRYADDPERLPLAEAAAQLLDVVRDQRGMSIDATIRLDETLDGVVTSTVLSILKEAVLNAARHAPGMPVTVALDSTGSEVRLSVTNPVRSADASSREGTGYGLIGAEERARLLDGAFDAGRSASGEWVATLRVPATSSPESTPVAQEVR